MEKTPTLVKHFGSQKRWVEWVMQTRDGKTTKVPLGKSDTPDTWSRYAELAGKNVGIMFGLKKQLLGIDIDKCLNLDEEVDHEKKAEIERLIVDANTYCEVSPSGTGLHLFLEIDEPLDLIANKKAPFEIYTHKRFFTVTFKPYGEDKPVRKVTLAEASKLLEGIGYPWKKEAEAPAAKRDFGMPTSILLDDGDLLKKMFASKTGADLKKLYDGDASKYGNDLSNADAALCQSLAFWCQGDREQMRRLWLGSTLGAREKTQQRKDYQDRTIDGAVANCKEFYKPSTAAIAKKLDIDFLFTLDAQRNKNYTQCTENICRVLRKHPSFVGRLQYDTFKNTYEIRDGKKWREIEDSDIITIQTDIQIIFNFFQKVGKDMVYDAIIKVTKEHAVDSAADYLTSLKWDGEARLDNWLSKVFGTDNDEYHQKVGSNWIKGIVSRIMRPGCKFDYVLVLEGAQGSKKSTSLNVLGGGWHIETTMSTDSKDFFMQFQGKAIVEFSEGETLSRTEVKRMKAIITTQSDKYRPPYERMSRDFPRRCVFAMTTNQEEYLKDETGNRRWLPVRLVFAEADIAWLAENRDQMFAEAYHRVIVLEETNYDFPHEATLSAQNDRRVSDPNDELVANWYFEKLTSYQRDAGITIGEVFTQAFNNGFTNKMNKYDEMSIANILKNTLKLKSVRESKNGVRATRWYPGEYVNGLAEIEGMKVSPSPTVALAKSLDDF